MRPRGLTLIEVLMAGLLLLVGVWVVTDIYSATLQLDVHTQNRSLAAWTADSFLDEIEAHPFGSPAPADWKLPAQGLQGEWSTVEQGVRLDGKPVGAPLHVQWNLQNGSFVRYVRDAPGWDVVTVVISWKDPTGTNPDYGPFRDRFFPGDDMHLVLQTPVWREP